MWGLMGIGGGGGGGELGGVPTAMTDKGKNREERCLGGWRVEGGRMG